LVWELICHHRYCWGTIAADRSVWRSDGQSFGVQPLTDHIGLHFPGPQSRIVVPRTEPWLSLTGIRVEIVTRLADTEGWLIDGGDTFGLHLNRGLLIGSGFGRDVINTLDSPLAIPTEQWIRLTFEHNGFNAMALFINDALAATRPVINAIPSAGPQGVVIGNGIGTTLGYLRGDIESVKVWRIDPRAMQREFLARPLDPAVAECWNKFLRSLRHALRNNPDCARSLADTLAGLTNGFERALAQKDQHDIDEFSKICDEYRKLWRAGLIDSARMQELAARLRAWLIAKGLFNPDDPALQKFIDDPCFQLILKQLSPLTCDPQLMVLLKAFAGNPQAPQAASRS
jgi:hypothetical protein